MEAAAHVPQRFREDAPMLKGITQEQIDEVVTAYIRSWAGTPRPASPRRPPSTTSASSHS